MFKISIILIIIVGVIALISTFAIGFNIKDKKYSSKKSFSVLGLIYAVVFVITIAVFGVLVL